MTKSYKLISEYFNEYTLTKKSELSATSLKYEGCDSTWKHILEKFENDDIG